MEPEYILSGLVGMIIGMAIVAALVSSSDYSDGGDCDL